MSVKNNFDKHISSIETVEEAEITIDGTDEGFTLIGVDMNDSLSESTTSQPSVTDGFHNIISLFRVNSIIMTFLILILIISSLAKIILKTKKLSTKNIHIYEVVAFSIVLLMVLHSTSLAFPSGPIYLFYDTFKAFIFVCPIIILVLEFLKSKNKEYDKSEIEFNSNIDTNPEA